MSRTDQVHCEFHRNSFVLQSYCWYLPDFYHNESQLFGVDTLKRDLTASAQILDSLRPVFESGDYRPAPIVETVTLAGAREGYAKVARGAAGRIVIRPHG